MGKMKDEMIKIHNDEIELYYKIKEVINLRYDINQKVTNILAMCRDFEYRHPINKSI